MQDYTFAIDSIQHVVNFASYFIFSFIGALLKEMYRTNNSRGYSFEPYKVVTGTIIAMLLSVAIKAYYAEFFDQYWGIMGIVCLCLGCVGFELFRYISTIKGIRSVIAVIRGNTSEAEDILDEINSNEDEPIKEGKRKYKLKNNTIEGPIARNIHEDKIINYQVQKPLIRNPYNDIKPKKENDDK